MKTRTSIKQKILLGYYLIPVLIIFLSIFTLAELRFLDKRIIFGETISEFFDTTLEIRRFEKNYFLYRKADDYRENMKYTNEAIRLLELNTQGFYNTANPQEITDLVNNLSEYKVLMDYFATKSQWTGRPGMGMEKTVIENLEKRRVLEQKIREMGKKIITTAEAISKQEHRNLRKILKTSQNVLITSIVLFSLIGIVIGQILSRMIVRPLTQLEKIMEEIADGRFVKVEIRSKDREIVSLTDAFNRMLHELELRKRYLVQSEKLASLGTLLSGVAHELNNPLSNISSSSQILMEEIEEDDLKYKKELLSQIEEQTGRAKKIVRSLLEFSRDRAFKKEQIPLKNLFDETLQFLKGQVPTKIEVALDIPENITIFADKQKIQQAFLNLIKNAIESITGQGRVLIRARRHLAGNECNDTETGIYKYRRYGEDCTRKQDSVNIIIRDTGAGIPPEILPKIFDPFFTTKEVGKGSGLGLAIVHDIIEEHYGCIGVESKIGQGTTFLIRLPVKEI